MQYTVWFCLTFGVVSDALSTWQQGPSGGGGVIIPKIIIPGIWKVNEDDTLLFLPLNVPKDFPLERIRIMTNGELVMVMVTHQAKEKPDTEATKKYKLILDALKEQAGYDETLLKKHLEEWYETEEDDEVRVKIKSALDSLKDVRDAKSGPPPTVNIPLSMLGKQASRRNASSTAAKAREVYVGFLAAATPHEAIADSAMKLPASQLATATKLGSGVVDAGHDLHQYLRIIKESFVVEIPFPPAAEQVFVVQTQDRDLMVTMPLRRKSLEAQGISTGGKPFIPSPIYNMQGQLIGGPDEAMDSLSMAPNLKTRYFVEPDALKPLEK